MIHSCFDLDPEALDAMEKWWMMLPALLKNFPCFSAVPRWSFPVNLKVSATLENPWQELEKKDCGWYIPHDKLPEALRAAVSQTPETLGKRQQCCRESLRTCYTAEMMTEKMYRCYLWATGRAEKPDFVRE